MSSYDILYTEELEKFNQDYLKHTVETAETSQDRDLSGDSIVIGTSAIVDTEIYGAVGMNSGIYNNPFLKGVNIGKKYSGIIFLYHFRFIIRKWMRTMLADS